MNKGQTIIELLITIGLSAILLPVLFFGFISTREGKAQQIQRLDAVSLLKEGEEAARNVREKGWTPFAANGTYHPVRSGNSWSLINGSEAVENYTRSIVIQNASRDSGGQIVSNGGTIDPSTKKVTVTVSWLLPFPSQVSSDLYFTRHLNNASHMETSLAEFNLGTKDKVTVTNTAGGEVLLGAGGNSNWCDPNLSLSALDLPGQGISTAISAIQEKAFVGTGENASGLSFLDVIVTDTDPPTANLGGTFDGYKTNDGVFGETGYGYIATETNSKEAVIINLSTNPYSEAGYFNAPGNTEGNSISVSGNIGFLTVGSKLYTFDLSSKTGSRPQLGAVSLAGKGTKVVVLGNYAYVSISDSSVEMQIIQIGNGGTTLTVIGQANVDSQGAKDVIVNSTGTRAYLATGQASTKREVFILDVSTKTGNRPLLGSYDTNEMDPTGITLVPGNRAIVVGTGGTQQYQVIDIVDETNPSFCGGLQISSGVNGVASVLTSSGKALSYIITGDATSEFKMIEGGPGGSFGTSGTFESSTFDAGSTVAFNRMVASVNEPAQTEIKFQVASANAVAGSCSGASFTFLGPEGNSTSYFTGSNPIAGSIPFVLTENYVMPGRCFRYKAYFSTTDTTQTPILYDLSINYSL